ncbi:hypothetical protein THTE_2417 [Thermogutta terrifontis]|uniref:Uncharacterized protein n=1 Tax=Thermogutta terrifontis TaxID=1331910 RepID=A0A286RGC6_9BACT|nr:hypothetical protein THTE_2417 [Thermogutta terrifontis]
MPSRSLGTEGLAVRSAELDFGSGSVDGIEELDEFPDQASLSALLEAGFSAQTLRAAVRMPSAARQCPMALQKERRSIGCTTSADEEVWID